MSLTIRQRWEAFVRLVIPEAPPEQIADMRRAFYAGALTTFDALVAKEGKKTMTIEEARANIERVDKELKEFVGELVVEAFSDTRGAA